MKPDPKFKKGDLVIIKSDSPRITIRGLIGTVRHSQPQNPPRPPDDRYKNMIYYWYMMELDPASEQFAGVSEIAVFEDDISLLLTPKASEVFGDILRNI